MIREVEMGPFKHTVDDGLDIRKAAFECMYTLLDTCLDRIDIFEFLNHLEKGLKDHYDIKMLTYLMVTRLSQLAPSAVLQRMYCLDKILKVQVPILLENILFLFFRLGKTCRALEVYVYIESENEFG